MAVPELQNLLQRNLSGAYNPVGLGFNPPAGLGPNPVRQLSAPDPSQVGYFPTGGSFGTGSGIEAILPLLQLIAPFVQGNVSISPFGGAIGPGSTSGNPADLLLSIVRGLQPGGTGTPAATSAANPMTSAGSAGAPTGGTLGATDPMQVILNMLGMGGGSAQGGKETGVSAGTGGPGPSGGGGFGGGTGASGGGPGTGVGEAAPGGYGSI
jgi:hypothetical protein